jgi:hypothetical protein
MVETLPPREEISRTVEELKKVCSSQCDYLDLRLQPVVGQRHPELMFEIRKNSQTAYYHLGIDFEAKIHRHPAITNDFDLGVILEDLLDQILPFLWCEYQILQGAVIDRYNNFIEDPRCPVSDIDVPIMDGVECARKKGANHN